MRECDERDDHGNLTPWVLACDALWVNRCDCDEGEPGTCLACRCEAAMRAERTRAEAAEAEVARLRALHEGLPVVYIKANGPAFYAGSAPGTVPSWEVHAEAEHAHQAWMRVIFDGKMAACVGILPLDGETLPEAVQSIASALVWSGIRAWRMKQQKEEEAK